MNILDLGINTISTILNFYITHKIITIPITFYIAIEIKQLQKGEDFYAIKTFNKVKSLIEKLNKRKNSMIDKLEDEE